MKAKVVRNLCVGLELRVSYVHTLQDANASARLTPPITNVINVIDP